MKARSKIALRLLCTSILGAMGTDILAKDYTPLTFGQYYEPYAFHIEPNAPGYTLPLDPNDITNLSEIDGTIPIDPVSDLIRRNGFAVKHIDLPTQWSDADNIVSYYEYLLSSDVPLFITTDTFLHLYHLQFDETLKGVEEREFIPDINNLTTALLNDAFLQFEQLDGDLKEAAQRNIAYLSVAQKLIDPNTSIPTLVDDMVLSELDKIEAHQGFAVSDIFLYKEDYSQYIPRGHYTRSEPLKHYFKTLMWYGRMAFLLKGGSGGLISEYDARIQTLQAFFLATSLKNVQIDERTGLDIWDRLYTVTAFYMGTADDLTPYDYLWALDQVFEDDFALSDLANQDTLLALKIELALLPSPKIYGGTGNSVLESPITNESLNEMLDQTKGMRLMGQRFIPDSYMFQNLVFPKVLDYLDDSTHPPFTAGSDGMGGLCRAYVRGLDVMAVLGSHEALKILIEQRDTDYRLFWQQFGEMKDEFDALSSDQWNTNLYWSWLYTVKALLEDLPEGYPNFMRTQAWQRHQLHTALISWTQLRHDTILYAKQSYTAGGSAPRPTPPPPGYIEPIPVFWGRLLAQTRMTSRGLDDLNVLTTQARWQFDELETMLQRIIEMVSKQLTNEPLSTEDCQFIKSLPATLDSILTGTEDIALKTTLVADVHTSAVERTVIEEAVGNVDLIVVACPNTDGSIFLTAGPVLSYYEFKHPMNDRLTDEAWRKLLDSPEKPERPEWYSPLTEEVDISF
ncbi:MAG: DUF3160 domain-containing protein [Sedimentisphaerales bacterium]|nr:DUF3160 domain-containing protein [Sedimentisphaerales bacterium]